MVAVTGTVLFLADRLSGGNGVAGLAAASTAGNAAAVPAIVATANSAYGEAAKSATVLVAASVVVTAIVVPLVTAWWPGASARRSGGSSFFYHCSAGTPRTALIHLCLPPLSSLQTVRLVAGTCRGRSRPTRFFFRAGRGDFDIVVAMYHDQGHGPVKVLGIEAGVNITVGLPVIRTSVDHGTAFDIAGKGIAEHSSMVAAIILAARLAGVEESGRAVEI